MHDRAVAGRSSRTFADPTDLNSAYTYIASDLALPAIHALPHKVTVFIHPPDLHLCERDYLKRGTILVIGALPHLEQRPAVLRRRRSYSVVHQHFAPSRSRDSSSSPIRRRGTATGRFQLNAPRPPSPP